MEVSLNSSALCSELPPPISPSGTEGDFQITFMKPLQDLHTVKKNFKALMNLMEEALLIWP